MLGKAGPNSMGSMDDLIKEEEVRQTTPSETSFRKADDKPITL